MHVMNIIAVFIAIPLFFFILTKKIKISIIHVVINFCNFFMVYDYFLDVSELFGNRVKFIENFFSFDIFIKAIIGFFSSTYIF